MSALGNDEYAPSLDPTIIPLERPSPRAKRALDVAIAAPVAVLLLPLMLVIALLVRLDSPGPAIFRQERIGRLGRPFQMWKFRSMRVGAAETIHRSAAGAWFAGAPAERGYKSLTDPRVTRMGRLLRETSLDELPQLYNVLRGEMSLVGPRPAIPYELELYEPWHRQRQLVLPGITGLWQVAGRDRLPAARMMELDVRYVGEWSLGLDLRILLWTGPALLGHYRAL